MEYVLSKFSFANLQTEFAKLLFDFAKYAVVGYLVFLWFACKPLLDEKKKLQFGMAELLAFTVGFMPTPALLAAIINGHYDLWVLTIFWGGGQLVGAYTGCVDGPTYSGWRSVIKVGSWTLFGGVVFPIMYGVLLFVLGSLIGIAVASVVVTKGLVLPLYIWYFARGIRKPSVGKKSKDAT